MNIVDAQLHLNRGVLDATLAEMDALGIQGVVLDELWRMRPGGDPTHIDPGFELPNGAWRATYPASLEASTLYPERFSYLVRVDRKDPDLDALLRILASEPAARAIRIQPAWTSAETRAFAAGAYDELFALADRYGLPIFAFIPGHAELLSRYLARFSRVQVVVDHCGMPFPGIPLDQPVDRPDCFAEVLKLAKFPNAALKWAHAQGGFDVHEYPYEALRPKLRSAIAAFGAERVMWASDKTAIPKHSWASLLGYLRDSPDLTREEKAWILGGSARRLLRWPAPAATA